MSDDIVLQPIDPPSEAPPIVEPPPDPVIDAAHELMRRAAEAQRLARIAEAADQAYQATLPEDLRATGPLSWRAAAQRGGTHRRRT